MQKTPIFNPRRIERARLAKGFSHADLAYAVRRVTEGRIKPNEQNVRKWIKGQHSPGVETVAAIATATGQEISFFFEPDSPDDDEEQQLLRDLQRLPSDLRERIEHFVRSRAEA